MQVIITRAKEQAQSLQMMCHQCDLNPVLLPCVEIRADTRNNSFKQAIAQFSKTDRVIVVSANAAKNAVPHWPISTKPPIIFAIGPTTAMTIENLNYAVDFIAEPHDSEGLLSLPALEKNEIKNKKIIIFCGYQPKPLLKEILEQRGASVQLAFCYERICPAPLEQKVFQVKINMLEPLVTISTSSALLDNLVFITPTIYLRLLTSSPLIVISASMVAHAESLGFSHIIQAKNASTEAIQEALIQHVYTKS